MLEFHVETLKQTKNAITVLNSAEIMTTTMVLPFCLITGFAQPWGPDCGPWLQGS